MAIQGYRSYRLAALRPFVYLRGDQDHELGSVALASGLDERLYKNWTGDRWLEDGLYLVARELIDYWRANEKPLPAEALVQRVADQSKPKDLEPVIEAAAQVHGTPMPGAAEIIYAVEQLRSIYVLGATESSFLQVKAEFKGGKSPALILEDHLTRVRQSLRMTAKTSDTEGMVSVKEALFDHLIVCPYAPEEVCYLGLEAIDKATGGMYPGDLIALLGLTNIGKSQLLFHTARHNAMQGRNIVLASAEMSTRRNLDRFAASFLKRDSSMISRPGISDSTRAYLAYKAKKEAGRMRGDIMILPPSMCSTTESIRDAFKELHKQGKADLLCVDYLTSGIAPKGRFTTLLDHQTVSTVALELKAIGDECQVPVLVVAQSKQGSEKRSEDKSNLGYSFATVQALDIEVEIRHANPEYDDLAKSDMRGIPPVRTIRATLVKGRGSALGVRADYEMDFRTGIAKNVVDRGEVRAEGFHE